MKLAIAFGKVLTLAGWAWGVLAFLAPTQVPMPGIGQVFLFGLIAVHLGEAFAFAKGLTSEDGGSVGSHAGRLLIFGYFHVLGVRYG